MEATFLEDELFWKTSYFLKSYNCWEKQYSVAPTFQKSYLFRAPIFSKELLFHNTNFSELTFSEHVLFHSYTSFLSGSNLSEFDKFASLLKVLS